MRDRIVLIHKKLKDTGSFYLHCDWHASHYLKVACDDIFGRENFRNEIVWCYASPSRVSHHFPRKHDIVLFYGKSEKTTLNTEQVRVPYDEKFTMGSKKSLVRKNRQQGDHTTDKGKYLESGKVVEDWWADIRPLSVSNEKIGYKTQKPEALLKRILLASSSKDDLVLDCFAGGGTTAKVCAELGRRFICGDVSPVAVRVIAARLNEYHPETDYKVLGLPRTERELKALGGHAFAELVCKCKGWDVNERKSGDEGIDGWANNKKVPIQIKNHAQPIGRPDIQKFAGAMSGQQEGLFVAWKFSKQAMEFIAKIKNVENKTIKAVKCGDIFRDILISENSQKKLKEYFTETTGGQWQFELDMQT